MVIVEAPQVWGDTVAAVIRMPDTREVVYVSVPGSEPTGTVDPFAVVGLLVAMRLGSPLVVEAPVSGRLLQGMRHAQGILAGFFDELTAVTVEADVRPALRPRAGATASFFTAGVDSTYLALTNRDALQALVTVPAFFAERGWVLDGEGFRAGVRASAGAIGLPLVEVATNIRQVLQPYVEWKHAHGAALAAVALTLADRFGEILLASSHEPGTTDPWGSHPDLDHHWSSDDLVFRQTGYDASRTEKLARIAARPDVVPWLQVCWQVDRRAYNCGHCEKCVRTALDLRAAGFPDVVPTLPHPSVVREAVRAELDDDLLNYSRNRMVAARSRGDNGLAAGMAVKVGLSSAQQRVRSAARAARDRRRS